MENQKMSKSTAEVVNDLYDNRWFSGSRLDFDKIGFHNIGHWKGISGSIEIAQLNLIETMVAFFINKDGNILDVACGTGASTKFLTKYFQARGITGINISKKQLEVAKAVAPECEFKLMNATNLEFPDSSIDNVLCIEAAFHFMTRLSFFEEAYRVLKPGGRLALSDFLYDHERGELKGFPPAAFPKENYLPNLDAYRANLKSAGFRYVRVEDSTEVNMNALNEHLITKQERDARADIESLQTMVNRVANPVTVCCMAYAIK
jgi:MPBQ/MSBQ methyltransferase